MSFEKKVALVRRWTRIALGRSATAVTQGVGKHYSKEEISGYYNDLTRKVGAGTLLDAQGIPVSEIASGEMVHFPIAIFQYGLALYDIYLETGKDADLERFSAIADWAVSEQRQDGSWDAFGPMKSQKYTVSSMCQGEGASLLFRAWKATGDDSYVASAFRAIDFMLKPYSEGGTAFEEDGFLYLEEYPQVPRRSVLNGWIFSIFGLYDACIVDQARYGSDFQKTMETLCQSLKSYDNGYWSLYDQQGTIASPAYHNLHIAQLKVLGDLYHSPIIDETSKRYRDYENRLVNRLRAITVKVIQKIFEDSDFITVQ